MKDEQRIFHGDWIRMNRFVQDLYTEIGYDELTYEHIVVWKGSVVKENKNLSIGSFKEAKS